METNDANVGEVVDEKVEEKVDEKMDEKVDEKVDETPEEKPTFKSPPSKSKGKRGKKKTENIVFEVDG